MSRRSLFLAALPAFALACGSPPAPVTEAKPVTSAIPAASASTPPDPMAVPPPVAEGGAFAPPVPTETKDPSGLTTWSLFRTTLPKVTISLVFRGGAAADPAGKSGTAHRTMEMLLEGTKKRDGVAFARALEALGASISTDTYADYTEISVDVLATRADAAVALVAEALNEPRFAQADFDRTQKSWIDALVAREKDPNAFADVAALPLVFPEGNPYRSPKTGTRESAKNVALADVKAFASSTLRPEEATLVVVGAADAEAVHRWGAALFHRAASERVPRGRTLITPANVAKVLLGPATKAAVVLYDRHDAPQTVLRLLLPGIVPSSPEGARATRVNVVLGASFTSRLNQDLREKRALTYGAGSRYSFAAGQGLFEARTSVVTDRTGEAARALWDDIAAFAKEGLTNEEVAKSKTLARSDLVEAYATQASIADRLARLAGTGLAAAFDKKSAELREGATKGDLNAIAKSLDPKGATLLVVGPAETVRPQLEKAGFTGIEVRAIK
jgi:predicted Zn-dependent peptidase